MAKYKIKVIQHLLKGNRIAKSGEVVDGSQFINLQASLDGGYIEEFKDKEDKKDEKVDAGDKPTPLMIELKKVKSLNKEKLSEYAVENKIEFDAELSKKDLLAFITVELEKKFSKSGE